MRRGRSTRIPGLLAVLLLVLVAWGLNETFEQREFEAPVGWSEAARANRWLALERLLALEGAQVRGVSGVRTLPPPGATLFLPQDRRTLSRQQSQALLDWVKSGGHLLVLPTETHDSIRSQDLLLDPLIGGSETGSSIWQRPPSKQPAPRHCRAPLPDGTGDLDVQTSLGLMVRTAPVSPDWEIVDCMHVTIFAGWKVGRGAISTGGSFFGLTNHGLGERDQAALAVWLLKPAPGQEIWVVRDGSTEPLLRQLLRWAPLACIGAVVCAILALWQAARTPGPRIALTGSLDARRSLKEHLQASGRLLWRLDRGSVLYERLRRSAVDALRRRHPGWRALDEDAVVERAAQLAGPSELAVRRALTVSRHRDPGEFVRDLRTLETLRKIR